jgi:hypothetical protein
MSAGHWKGVYASKNEREWFAEMTRFYFAVDGDGLAFYDPRSGKGRAFLRAEDPEAFALVDDLYQDRLDPGVVRILRVEPGAAADEPKLRSDASKVPADLEVQNLSSAPIRLVWVDFEGRRDRRQPLAESPRALPGDAIRESSWTGHTFVITDDDGRGLCTFKVGELDTRVDYRRPCR